MNKTLEQIRKTKNVLYAIELMLNGEDNQEAMRLIKRKIEQLYQEIANKEEEIDIGTKIKLPVFDDSGKQKVGMVYAITRWFGGTTAVGIMNDSKDILWYDKTNVEIY